MRWMLVLTLSLLGVWETTATAQMTNPNAPAGNANMGAFGRNNQPLSPYLNLLRASSNAVNYYYGVRGGAQPFGFTGMFNQNSQQGPRQTFFPLVDNLAELADDPRDVRAVTPTGHPVGFGNTLGYFGGQPPARGQQPASPVGRRR